MSVRTIGTRCQSLWTLLVLSATLLVAAQPAGKPAPVISACDKPFMFGFGSWEKAQEMFPARADGIHLSAKSAQGGAGMAGLTMNLAGFGDWSPTLMLTVTGQNQAAALNLHLGDADGTRHTCKFDLRKLKPGAPQQVVPDYGASLAEPQIVETAGTTPGLDLARISIFMVIGDWSSKPVDLVLSGIALVPPTDALRGGRAELKELQAREAEQARLEAEAKTKARQNLLAAGAAHPTDGPEVRHVCAVAADVIAITLQAGQHVSNQLVPYVAEPGDEIAEEEKGQPRHEVKDGRVIDYFAKALYRRVNKRRTKVGLLSPDRKQVFIEANSTGQLLEETVVDLPAAYMVQSADDATYATPLAPREVYRKGKPNGYSQPLPFLHTISLKLPAPLKEGATYTIRFVGVNTSRETVTYVHQPRQTRSLAVHAIQTGYRPDDPYKRAYFSFWMGVDKDGRHGSSAQQPAAFELVDAVGKTVYTG